MFRSNRSLGRAPARDIPHRLDGYDDEDPAHTVEIHNNMPSDDDEGELPSWFTEHRDETSKRFGALDYVLKSLGDRLKAALGRSDDEEVEDPNIASGEPIKPGEPITEGGPPPGMQRVTRDSPIRTLADLNVRNHQLHPRRTRDHRMGPVRSLKELGVYLKSYYQRPLRTRDC